MCNFNYFVYNVRNDTRDGQNELQCYYGLVGNIIIEHFERIVVKICIWLETLI